MYTNYTILFTKRKSIHNDDSIRYFPGDLGRLYCKQYIQNTKYRIGNENVTILRKKILSFQSYNSLYQFKYAMISLNFFERGEICSIILF